MGGEVIDLNKQWVTWCLGSGTCWGKSDTEEEGLRLGSEGPSEKEWEHGSRIAGHLPDRH